MTKYAMPIVAFGAARKTIKLSRHHSTTLKDRVIITALSGIGTLFLWPVYAYHDVYDMESSITALKDVYQERIPETLLDYVFD